MALPFKKIVILEPKLTEGELERDWETGDDEREVGVRERDWRMIENWAEGPYRDQNPKIGRSNRNLSEADEWYEQRSSFKFLGRETVSGINWVLNFHGFCSSKKEKKSRVSERVQRGREIGRMSFCWYSMDADYWINIQQLKYIKFRNLSRFILNTQYTYVCVEETSNKSHCGILSIHGSVMTQMPLTV